MTAATYVMPWGAWLVAVAMPLLGLVIAILARQPWKDR